MSDHIDTGGPAFPCMPPQDTAAGIAVGYPFPDSGMTIRDYFAAKAITGFLRAGDDSLVSADDVAAEAYKLADAMLRARKGGA